VSPHAIAVQCARPLAADPRGLPVGECARYDAACLNPAGAIQAGA